RWFLMSATPLGHHTGGVVVAHTNITERKRAEQEIQKSERQFRELADAIPQIVWVAGPDGGLTHLNQRATEYSGLGVNELTGWSWERVIHPQDLELALATWTEVLTTGQPQDLEFRIRRADGDYRWHIVRMVPSRDSAGTITTWYGTCTDIEDQKQSELSLRDERTLLRTIIDAIPDVVFAKDRTGRYTLCNQAFLKFAGAETENELTTKDAFGIFPEEHAKTYHAADQRLMEQGSILECEAIARDHTGTDTWREVIKAPLRNHTGEIVGLVGISRSIQTRRKREQVLAESRERLQLALSAAQMGTWDWDLLTNRVVRSLECRTILGGEETTGDRAAFMRLVHPDDIGLVQTEIDRAIAERGGFSCELRILRPNGELRWIHDMGRVHCDDAGIPTRMIGLKQDITEKKRADADQQKLVSLIEHSREFIAMADLEGRLTFANLGARRMIGLGDEEEIGQIRISDYVAPEWIESFRDTIIPTVRESGLWEGEMQLRHLRTGAIIDVYRSIFLINDPASGSRYFATVTRDITESKRLESQFQQSRKMEAVGRLAGGVAHDFNNLLTVINGFAELLLLDFPLEERGRESVEAIQDAGKRAARLTRQLLDFSRQAMVEPRILNLNLLVDETAEMMRRLIGDNVTLDFIPDPALGKVKADPGQLEQVIMNLVLNARDAMPAGGRVTITTRDMTLTAEDLTASPELIPGRFAEVTFTDAGVGMSDAVKSRIFEPFYTTKGVGKGTGLGLAVVHGVVRQAGGAISVESEVGRGTTFTIHLPTVLEEPPAPDHETPKLRNQGSETILLVEDEAAVRTIARRALELQGFKVLEAGSGVEAIELSDTATEPIALLVTDVMMPGMGGRQLAEKLQSRLPGLRVLYISGYTDDVVLRSDVTDRVEAFLQKPFSPIGLARKVREVLDMESSPGDPRELPRG
ncbi:MAG: PAS domain S-box protein, partial [Planctomycetota bacterium]|nr:PAS domain S-box protein [Planctomycetota bacterium]